MATESTLSVALLSGTALGAWRRAQRAHWVSWREAQSAVDRQLWNQSINALLFQHLPVSANMVIGFCWPFKSEVDVRPVIRQWRDMGVKAVLPEVLAPGQPLQFRQWWPGVKMARRVYDIPVPVDSAVLIPDMVIAPMNAVDHTGYRLGYGGGYFDRTLAALQRRVVAVGVGYSGSSMASIVPQSYDVPMDFVVTELACSQAGGQALLALSADDSRLAVAHLLTLRGLPRTL
jgi:5-formyltetrahydrofolate cyclo-ligase